MADKRIIKRYTNRKLYDKLESRYVTLEEIARLVRGGEDVMVIDNESEEDLTAVTFAQIILEEEKRKTNLISVPFLRKIIRSGEARVQDFSDRASRSIEVIGDFTEKAGERVREVVEGSGKAIGDRFSALEELFEAPQRRFDALRDAAKKSVGKLGSNPTVRRELERIAGSLRTIEEAIGRLADDDHELSTDRHESTRGESHRDAARTASVSERSADRGANGLSTPAGPIESSDVSREVPYSSSDEANEEENTDGPVHGTK